MKIYDLLKEINEDLFNLQCFGCKTNILDFQTCVCKCYKLFSSHYYIYQINGKFNIYIGMVYNNDYKFYLGEHDCILTNHRDGSDISLNMNLKNFNIKKIQNNLLLL